MRTINVVFWIIAVIVGLECLFFVYRGVSIIGDYSGVLRWMWIFKIATYLGIVLMGFLLFRIKQTLSKHHFFDSRNIMQLRSFGFTALLVAILNSFANAGMDTWHHYKKEVSFNEAWKRFLLYLGEHVFDHSLIVYVLVISILMLAYFSRRAVDVKRENEAFI